MQVNTVLLIGRLNSSHFACALDGDIPDEGFTPQLSYIPHGHAVLIKERCNAVLWPGRKLMVTRCNAVLWPGRKLMVMHVFLRGHRP